ncbi:hypothetical protein MUK42_22955 [Musa troglodytarum]|uniref:Uncharacterized protein n=1 Tax=Musa troglodytarum TaxID=320322 RepID=A0A9E7GDN9_9LILI|nr:hypothetical protein MUK42_22955 [Musa troglodytarum]
MDSSVFGRSSALAFVARRGRGILLGRCRGRVQAQGALLGERAKRASRSGWWKYPFSGGALLLPDTAAGYFF